MITPEDKRSDDGARQARLAAKLGKKNEGEAIDVSTMSPEEYRKAKIEEALFERRRLNALLKADNERIASERRAFAQQEVKP